MTFFQSKENLFYFLIILFCLLQTSLIKSQEIKFGDGIYNFIYIKNQIIGINNQEDDYNIYYFDEINSNKAIIGNYTEIKNNKNIIKIDDDYFLIVGFDNNGNFRYIRNLLNSSDIISYSVITQNIISSNIDKYNLLCLSKEKCFMFFVGLNSNFYIYKLELEYSNGSPQEIRIPDDISNMGDGYSKDSIQCESSNRGNIILCICSWKRSNDDWKNKYLYINVENNEENSSGTICPGDKCYLGSIKKVDDSANKYLICYEQTKDSNKISVYCKYYYIKNKQISSDEELTELITLEGLTAIYERPLFINIYKNTIIIENDFTAAGSQFAILILSSLDFKITMRANAIVSYKSTKIVFNNDINYYIPFYKDDMLKSETYISKKSFMTCSNKEYFMIGNEQSIEVDLFKEQINSKIGFSLDSGIKIYKENDNLNFNKNFITIQNAKYTLNKIIDYGILNNYYAFAYESNMPNIFNSFSLICQMKVIICHKTCKNCSSELTPTSTNDQCNECDLKNYFPINIEKRNSPNGFNCYSLNDSRIAQYYLYEVEFYKCSESCKSCNNSYSCNLCKEGYYFKATKDNTIIFNDKCIANIPDSYYLDFDANIKVGNEIIRSVYKPCYKTCKSCSGPGDYDSNSCTSCIKGYMQYEFNKQQCTTNYTDCLNNKTFWKLENNNIICIPQCNQSFIISGDNEGQCVENCENYINPFSIEQNAFLLPYQCNNSNYCIPYSDCYKGSFYVSDDGKKCERRKRCIAIDIFDENKDPFEIEPEEEIEEEEEEDVPLNYDTKIQDIYNRLKIMKILTDNKTDSEVLEMFNGNKIIEKYNTLLTNEMSNIVVNDKYLITSTRYINFTITIYPLDIEDFVYTQVITPNNLGFINFTKAFPEYIYYEINTSNLILVCLLEHHNENSSINDLNYYLYSFNEKNYGNPKFLGEEIVFNETEEFALNDDSILETQYILYNYLNKSSLVNKRNSDYLVDNIKDFYTRYPEVELYNIKDPFYNDICFLFTSDQGADMTLDDRRKEYYVNASLCEDNCILIKIINLDSEPRSVCTCDIKGNLSLNNNEKKDDIRAYSVFNIKSFKCISETYNFNLKKNGNFWIFIIILIIQVYLLIVCIKHRENIINTMLGLFEVNSSVNKQLIGSSSEGSSNYAYEYKKNVIKISNNKEIDNSDDKIESQKEEILSAPVNVSNPPRRKIDLKKPNNTSTKTDIKIEEKDLISGNESSIIKGSTIKNQQDFTDISFDDIQEGYNPFQIDNLVLEQKGIMLKDNYLKNPLLEEKLKKMKKIKKSLRPLGQKDRLKFSDTCEDLLYSNTNKEKFNNKKNKKITRILGGQEIFKNYLIENYSDNEDNPRYPKTKIKNEEIFQEDKGLIGDEIIFRKIKANRPFLLDEGDSKNKIRITSNKNVEDLFEGGSKKNTNNNNTLAKSLGKKEINKLKEEVKNSEERLKTEIEYDTNNKIKEELQKISKENQRLYSSVVFGKNRKKNGLLSSQNDLNKKNNSNPLTLKSKKEELNKNNNNIGNKESSRVSAARMLRFAEENEMVGDQNVPSLKDEDEEKIQRKRTRNLELLRSKNFFTSMTELLETQNKEILVEENFILYYWKYFIRREIWLLTIINEKENIPYFIRYSSLAFCISFISLLNCFFFFESDVHRRYINALNGNKNGIKYYFKKEFITTIFVALIGNLFKMIIIKLVVYKLFKIGKKTKKMMRASAEIGLTPEEIEELHLKRQKYLKRYKISLLVYFILLMALNILIAYICICYAGVFYNSQGAFLYGLLFSLILSFIFCAIICFLIVCLYRLGKYLKSKCTISAYIVLSALY